MASLNSVSQWDEIVDVLICGYGCAGASAAIEARDTAPDARVLIVEKAPQEFAGGNCRVGPVVECSSKAGGAEGLQRKMTRPIP